MYPPTTQELLDSIQDLQRQLNELHEKLNDCLADLDDRIVAVNQYVQQVHHEITQLERFGHELAHRALESESRLAALSTIVEELRTIVGKHQA